MVESILNNCIVKRTAFKSFYNPENFRCNHKFDNNVFIRRNAYCFGEEHISIQAGDGLYSEPRAYDLDYTSFELGFPNFDCEYLKPYAEDENDLQGTVYGYVPWQVVIYLMMDKKC